MIGGYKDLRKAGSFQNTMWALRCIGLRDVQEVFKKFDGTDEYQEIDF